MKKILSIPFVLLLLYSSAYGQTSFRVNGPQTSACDVSVREYWVQYKTGSGLWWPIGIPGPIAAPPWFTNDWTWEYDTQSFILVSGGGNSSKIELKRKPGIHASSWLRVANSSQITPTPTPMNIQVGVPIDNLSFENIEAPECNEIVRSEWTYFSVTGSNPSSFDYDYVVTATSSSVSSSGNGNFSILSNSLGTVTINVRAVDQGCNSNWMSKNYTVVSSSTCGEQY